MARVIQPDEFELELARVRTLAAGDVAGVVGPGSLSWRVGREAALFLGAGRALLLQLSHPWVAAGIAEHSSTLEDPVGRFHRTFAVMFTLMFGSLEQAMSAARRLNRRHAAVRGTLPWDAGRFASGSPYSANEASALQWVHATLVETSLIAHDLVLPPLTAAERERYYGESRLFAAMFGLRSDEQPPTWDAFVAYNKAMWDSGELAVTPAARRIAGEVLGGASWIRSPGWYRALTAGLLPEEARRGFDLQVRDRDRRRCDRMLRVLRRVYPAAPARLRYVGPYQEAVARVSRRTGPDLLTRGLNRLWIGRATMPDPAPPGEAQREGA